MLSFLFLACLLAGCLQGSQVDETTAVHILHIVSPYRTSNTDTILTQNLSLASIEIARQYVLDNNLKLVVDVIAAVEEEKAASSSSSSPGNHLWWIPDSFLRYSFARSSSASPKEGKRNQLRTPPQLKDVLSAAFANAHSNYTHVVFTNADM